MRFVQKFGLQALLLSSALALTACGGGGGGDGGGSGGGGPNDPLQPTPSGRVFYSYATNDISGGPDTISIYRADAAVGNPTIVRTMPAGVSPAAVAVVSNRFVYVANAGVLGAGGDLGNVSAYSIAPTTGDLTAIGGSPFTAGSNPTAVAASPNAQFLYVANSQSASVTAFSIGASGALTLVNTASTHFGGSNGATPMGLAVSPNGRYLYCANKYFGNAGGNGTVTVFDIGTNGGITAKQNIAAGIDPVSLAIDASGTSLYAANNILPDDPATTGVVETRQGTVSMLPINASNGTLGASTAYTADILPQSVVIDRNNNVYVANNGSNNISVFTRAANGTLTPAGALSGGQTPWGLGIDPSGSFLYAANAAVDGQGGLTGFALQAGAAPRTLSPTFGAKATSVASTAVLP